MLDIDYQVSLMANAIRLCANGGKCFKSVIITDMCDNCDELLDAFVMHSLHVLFNTNPIRVIELATEYVRNKHKNEPLITKWTIVPNS